MALLVAALAAIMAGTFWSPYYGLGAFAAAIVVWFVVSIAWMRPRDSDEDVGSRQDATHHSL